MTVAEILLELATRGVLVTPEGTRLRLYPGSALTPELVAGILEHKRELLAALRDPTLRAPALPTHAEWRILTVLSRGPSASRRDLAAAVGLPAAALDHALSRLLRRRELTFRGDGFLSLNAC
jgi:hypothetical protein